MLQLLVRYSYFFIAVFLVENNYAQTVGIGTSSFTPGSMLSVKGNMSVGDGYETTAAPTDGMIIRGNVGIGTTSPSTSLEIASNNVNPAIIVKGANNTERIQLESYGASTGPFLSGIGAGGTPASPTQTTANMSLAGMVTKGYDNTNTLTNVTSRFRMRAEEAFTTTAQGTYYSFETMAAGTTTLNEKMRLTSAGNLGIGTTTVTQKLEVNGAIDIGTTASATTGAIRWSGTDFEGYNGSAWKSLTAGADCGKAALQTKAALTTSSASYQTVLNESNEPGVFYGIRCKQASGAPSPKILLRITIDGNVYSNLGWNIAAGQDNTFKYPNTPMWLWDLNLVWKTATEQIPQFTHIEYNSFKVEMLSDGIVNCTCEVLYGTD